MASENGEVSMGGEGGNPHDEYFTSYDDLEIHKLMLEDAPRTTAYQQAIEKADIRGKVVLDVGAGSGILSLFCLRAGARRVYAVEACPGMARPLQEVITTNGGGDVVKVIASRVEDIPSLPEPVDVIVSEWMGFYLLHESMLDSVLVARDRFLRPETGIMLPSHATIYTAPCSLDEHWKSKVNFWDNVYGFDMSALGREVVRRGRGVGAKPEVMVLKPEQILAEPVAFAQFDLRTCTTAELDALSNRHFVSIKRTGNNHGIALWFDCQFDASGVVLSTSPLAPPTHWKQTVIVTASSSENKDKNDAKEENINLVEEDDIIGWELVLNRVDGDDEMTPDQNGETKDTVNGKKRSRHDANGSRKSEKPTCRSYVIQVRALDPIDDSHPVPCNCQMAKCVLMQALLKQEDEEIYDENGEIMDLT